METTTEKGKRSTLFSSFSEFMDYAESPCDCPSRASHRLSSDDGHSWTLGVDFKPAMTLAREGWPEGAALLESYTARLENITSNKLQRAEYYYDVEGMDVDAGLFSIGAPECMQVEEIVDVPEGAGKVVRVLMNLSASCGVGAEQMVKRGAAALALVDALETMGKSVELTVCSGIGANYNSDKVGGDILQYVIPVKKAGESLDLDRMAFMLAHPATFRRLIFSCMEHEPQQVRSTFSVPGMYGYPAKTIGIEADVVVPEMLWRSSDEDLVAWVMAELEKQGVAVEA